MIRTLFTRRAVLWLAALAALLSLGSCATPPANDWCGTLPPVYGDDC